MTADFSKEVIIFGRGGSISRKYSGLKRGSDAAVIRWIADQDFSFASASGAEIHDIGDEFAHETIKTDDVEKVLSLVERYGDWEVIAFYQRFRIRIEGKSFSVTGIPDPLSFGYPVEADEVLQDVFRKFKEAFCWQDIITKEYHNR